MVTGGSHKVDGLGTQALAGQTGFYRQEKRAVVSKT